MAKKFRQRENTASLTKQMLGIEEPQEAEETEKSESMLPTEESRTLSNEGLLNTHLQEQQKANESINAYMQGFSDEQKQIFSEAAMKLYDEPIPEEPQSMAELFKQFHEEKQKDFSNTDNENVSRDSKPKALTKKFKRTKRVQILITEQLYETLKETAELNDMSMNELINQCIEKNFYK